ncbi:ABC transporter permease [Bacteroidota bacterium]
MTWEDKYFNQNKMPPKWADRFLEWYCSDNYIEEVKGDLHELYINRIIKRNILFRKMIYWWNVIRFFRPYILKNKLLHINVGEFMMLGSYIKIAVRNLKKHAFYSLINITGLVTGIACVLFITLFVFDELSFDKFNKKADRTYRLVSDFMIRGNEFQSAMSGGPVGQGMMLEFPEVEQQTRVLPRGSWFIKHKDITHKEELIHFADSTFFDVFSIEVIAGNKEDALKAPNSLMLSETMAKKYFGEENPVGTILRLDDRVDYSVTGVFKDFPHTSHFRAEFLASASSFEISRTDFWSNANFYTYIVLKEGADPNDLVEKYPSLLQKYVKPEIEMLAGVSIGDFAELNLKFEWILQPLTDIHLYSEYDNEMGVNGDIQYVYIFSAIGLFILLLACINFVNLATARSTLRAKEVGIKKVVGSDRKSLITQFLAESVVISLIALIIGLVLVYTLLPYFNILAGKTILYSNVINSTTMIIILAIPFITGILAGSFPAFVLSAFNPAIILKGNLSSGVKKGWLRSGLVTFQFTTSIILIVCTLVVFNQLSYIQNKKLGFNKEQVLIVNDAFILRDMAETFKQEVLRNPSILSGTMSGYLPVVSSRSKNGTIPDGDMTSDKFQPIQSFRVDTDYIKTMGMEIVIGRDFSKEFPTDSVAAIINEACAKEFGWDNPLDHTVAKYYSVNPPAMHKYQVIGVVKDFHFESLKNNIEPVIMYLERSRSNISFRFNSANTTSVISHIKSMWEETVPGQPFDYRFLDESFNDMYKAEIKVGDIFGTFASLAVIVGCLGLFGLSAFTAERKTKEIGIRKVHGASVKSVVILLSKEFAKLILISFVIAAPIAYYLMSTWLENYAYRTGLNVWTFILSGLLAMFVALVTVSYHAVKAGLINPAESLKYE